MHTSIHVRGTKEIIHIPGARDNIVKGDFVVYGEGIYQVLYSVWDYNLDRRTLVCKTEQTSQW